MGFRKKNRTLYFGIITGEMILAGGLMGIILSIFGLVFMSLSFETQQHNIDSAFNMANILCDDCTRKISDEGRGWNKEPYQKTLADLYMDSIINAKITYFFSIWVALILGLLLSSILDISRDLGRKQNELRKFRKIN